MVLEQAMSTETVLHPIGTKVRHKGDLQNIRWSHVVADLCKLFLHVHNKNTDHRKTVALIIIIVLLTYQSCSMQVSPDPSVAEVPSQMLVC